MPPIACGAWRSASWSTSWPWPTEGLVHRRRRGARGRPAARCPRACGRSRTSSASTLVERLPRGCGAHRRRGGRCSRRPRPRCATSGRPQRGRGGPRGSRPAPSTSCASRPSPPSPPPALVGALRRRHPGVTVRIAQPEASTTSSPASADGRSELAVTELTGDLDRSRRPRARGPGLRGPRPRPRRPLRAASPRPPWPSCPIVTAPRAPRPVVSSTRCTPPWPLPAVVVETEHREAMVALVAAGAGVALVPRPAVPPPPASGVDRRRAGPPGPTPHRAGAPGRRRSPRPPRRSRPRPRGRLTAIVWLGIGPAGALDRSPARGTGEPATPTAASHRRAHRGLATPRPPGTHHPTVRHSRRFRLGVTQRSPSSCPRSCGSSPTTAAC